MAKRTKKLGRQLLDTLRDVHALMGATTNPDRLQQLVEQRARLLKQIGDLVDKNITQASKEYKAATTGLQQASAKIRTAIEGIESVANAITTVAKALDLVSKVK